MRIGVNDMNKGLAIQLLNSQNGVFLTSEGKKVLETFLNKNSAYSKKKKVLRDKYINKERILCIDSTFKV
jgi:hypothetical protein